MTHVATPPSRGPDVFAALADRTRRDLLQTLVRDGASSASALARRLPITRQAVGKHLEVLHRARLVQPRRAGREVRYEPRLEPLHETTRWIEALARQWDSRLHRLADLAESPDTRPIEPTPGES